MPVNKHRCWNDARMGDSEIAEQLLVQLSEEAIKKLRRRIEDRLRKDPESVVKTALLLKIKWHDLKDEKSLNC